ncbi:hypothetical protein ACODT4_44650 [Streptomyces sp. 2.9]|uniref:hypothetical protein n=1 Tax=Streptomyces tritrimontium TaxID=3406573 RepID=UPI003BB80D37
MATTFITAAEIASRDVADLMAKTDAPEQVLLLASRNAHARRAIADLAARPDLTDAALADLVKAAEFLDESMIHLNLDADRAANDRTRRYLDGADELISCARMLIGAALNERLDRQQDEREEAAAARTARTPEQLAAEDAEEVRELVRIGVKELLRSLPGLNRFKRVRATG